jgi:GxxExxY protein
MDGSIILKEEAYDVIGACMEVHSKLGHGFLEAVYKDALEIEFAQRDIPYFREHEFDIEYKGHILKRKYYADFTVYGKIILEAKALDGLPEALYSRGINYLKVSNYRLCLLVNFGSPRLQYKRIVL